MTVDLRPRPSAPALVRAERTADRTHPSRLPAGRQHGWAQVEQDCPYCSGPETD
ncbi:hypothetical protein [Kocuria sp. U4B]